MHNSYIIGSAQLEDNSLTIACSTRDKLKWCPKYCDNDASNQVEEKFNSNKGLAFIKIHY